MSCTFQVMCSGCQGASIKLSIRRTVLISARHLCDCITLQHDVDNVHWGHWTCFPMASIDWNALNTLDMMNGEQYLRLHG